MNAYLSRIDRESKRYSYKFSRVGNELLCGKLVVYLDGRTFQCTETSLFDWDDQDAGMDEDARLGYAKEYLAESLDRTMMEDIYHHIFLSEEQDTE